MMSLRLSAFGIAAACLTVAAFAADAVPLPRVATFTCDVTPPPGEVLVWTTPVTEVAQPLLAKGVVIEAGAERVVLCTFDWCEICNDTDLMLRTRLGEAVGVDPLHVIVHVVHQHGAAWADSGAHALCDAAPNPPRHLSDKFMEEMTARLCAAAKASLAGLRPFDRLGTGQAKVERVASTRRIRGEGGMIIVRYSVGGKDPTLAAAPEGDIDPYLKTVTFAEGNQPLVRLHFYATHPQTFACTGVASSDFVGKAREALQAKEKVFQIYFTGCGGDITVGKYNDGTDAAREALASRLLAGMEASAAATKLEPIAGAPRWRSVPLSLAFRTAPGYTEADRRAKLDNPAGEAGSRVYVGAIALAFARRIARPLPVSGLRLGAVDMLFLPGEPLLEFQRFAQAAAPARFVAVAGYCDCGPGYICTDAAFVEGGYEPTDANVDPGSEALLKKAIRELVTESR